VKNVKVFFLPSYTTFELVTLSGNLPNFQAALREKKAACDYRHCKERKHPTGQQQNCVLDAVQGISSAIKDVKSSMLIIFFRRSVFVCVSNNDIHLITAIVDHL